MHRYSFVLHDGEHLITDDVWLAHREHAIDHAHTVARELMFGRELECRSWCLDLYENGESSSRKSCSRALIRRSIILPPRCV